MFIDINSALTWHQPSNFFVLGFRMENYDVCVCASSFPFQGIPTLNPKPYWDHVDVGRAPGLGPDLYPRLERKTSVEILEAFLALNECKPQKM